LGITIVLSRTKIAKAHGIGYIDKTGQFVIAPRFTLADWFSEGLAAVRVIGEGRRIKYIDRTGRIVIDSREGVYHSSDATIPLYPLFTFHEGFRRIRLSSGKSGFIGKNGEITVDPIFDWTSSFSEGLSAVKIGKLWGYIDKAGELIIGLKFDCYPGPFSEGLAVVKVNGKYGYIDKKGTVVIKPRFDSAYPFSEGLAVVKVNGKLGFIDGHGNFVITPQFDDCRSHFSDGRAIVTMGSKWQVIDKIGKSVVKPGLYSFCRESGFAEDLSVVKDANEEYGFINTDGKLVIGFNFDYALAFSEGLAAVKVDNAWGYIDKKGKFIIKPNFSWASSFSEGLAAANYPE